MGRSPCCSKEGLNRGTWTVSEDKILRDYIKIHGEGNWRNLPTRAGLKRCGKSCRLRWLNYLRPDIKRGNISEDEEELIIRLHKLLGNRWSLIAGRLPGRTDNEIKNYWNTNLGKKVIQHRSTQRAIEKRAENDQMMPCKIVQQPTIRSKASRCTKVIVVPAQDHMVGDQGGSKHSNEILSPIDQTPHHDIFIPSFVDFEVSDLDMAEPLDFAFNNFYVDDSDDQYYGSPPSNLPFLFAEEVETTTPAAVYRHVSQEYSHLGSLPSVVLDAEEEWLGE